MALACHYVENDFVIVRLGVTLSDTLKSYLTTDSNIIVRPFIFRAERGAWSRSQLLAGVVRNGAFQPAQ